MITVCVTTYNGEKTLEKCVNAVASMGNFEWIIYDNGSTDGTAEVIKKLSEKLPIRTKYLPKDDSINNYLNISKATKQMISEVTTPYVFLLDDDVLIDKGNIQELIQFLDDKTGATGFPYEHGNHLRAGAMMMKTEVAKKLVLDWSHNCTCGNIAAELKNLGMETKIIQIPQKHIKFENRDTVIAIGSVEMFGVKYAVEQDQNSKTNSNIGQPRMYNAQLLKQKILELETMYQEQLNRWTSLLKLIE